MTKEAAAQQLLDMADLLRPSAIRAAATIGLADHVAEGVSAPRELAEATGCRADMMTILLRYLAELDVVRQLDAEQYELAPLGEALRDNGSGVRESLSTDGMFGLADMALVNILHTIRTGETCYASMFGRGYWESLNNDPRYFAALEANMPADGTEQLSWDTNLVVDEYDWNKVGHVVDVGGHSGALLIELLRRYPRLRGTLVDLPNSVELARRRLACAGIAERCSSVAGSFFDPLVADGDVYLLSAILADWSDADAVRILRRCGEAAGRCGKVLLAEVNLSTELPRAQLWLRASMPAPTRSIAELKELGAAAGLRVSWEGPATPIRSLLEFVVD